jgi:hypothetical protein
MEDRERLNSQQGQGGIFLGSTSFLSKGTTNSSSGLKSSRLEFDASLHLVSKLRIGGAVDPFQSYSFVAHKEEEINFLVAESQPNIYHFNSIR